MKTSLLSLLIMVAWLAFTVPGNAADPKAQLQELTEKVRAKVKAGKKAETDFTEELKAFDALIEEQPSPCM